MVAFRIAKAAKMSAVSVERITLAVRDGELPAHRIDDQAIILREDLTAWVKTFPEFAGQRGLP